MSDDVKAVMITCLILFLAGMEGYYQFFRMDWSMSDDAKTVIIPSLTLFLMGMGGYYTFFFRVRGIRGGIIALLILFCLCPLVIVIAEPFSRGDLSVFAGLVFVLGGLAFVSGGIMQAMNPGKMIPWIPFIGGGVIVVFNLISIC